MQHAGREHAVLAPHAGVQQAHDDVGILLAPAAVIGVEAVDPLEIGAPDREVAGARAAPAPAAQAPQRAERQMPERRQAVDAAARALRQPLRQAPALGREFFAQHARGQRGRQQHAVAGDEPARLGETPVRGDEIRLHEAVAVEENDVARRARQGSRGCGFRRRGSRDPPARRDRGGGRPCRCQRSSNAAVGGPDPSSATITSKSPSVWPASERSTASSASSRL